jgi:hypothetical protein
VVEVVVVVVDVYNDDADKEGLCLLGIATTAKEHNNTVIRPAPIYRYFLSPNTPSEGASSLVFIDRSGLAVQRLSNLGVSASSR